MRVALLSSLLSFVFAYGAAGFEIDAQRLFPSENATRALRVISTTDTDLFSPLIADFQQENPSVEITYVEVGSSELMKALYDEKAQFDLAISSAMDLQIKLSNDGLTRPHDSRATGLVPEWGKWRDHVFAFTQEPATIVVSPPAFEGLAVPQTRQELITLLRDNADRFHGRVGTYDIRQSGLGYLFATQDSRASETYWRLTEVMGNLEARLYCCSGDMISDVASGEIAVAYNVLGSYALARQDQGDRINIVIPRDFTTVMLRSAVIPSTADQPELAGLFLDHLLLASWGGGNVVPFPAPEPEQLEAAARPIPLGPGLLVFLDPLKRKRFLDAWSDAILR